MEKEQKTVQIPREWLVRLIYLSDALLSTSQGVGVEGKERLLGCIESAKHLLAKGE